MSEKIKWVFSKLYIQKKNSFLDRESKIFFFSLIIFIFGFFRILQLYFIQKSMIHDVPNHIVIKTAASHMHKNYFRLFNKNADPSKFIFIECFNKHQFTKIKKLNLLKN